MIEQSTPLIQPKYLRAWEVQNAFPWGYEIVITRRFQSIFSLSEKESEFEDVLKNLDKSEVRIVVRLETRKFRKPVTMVLGLPKEKHDLEELARNLKKKLATGGTAKDCAIQLQGDHRDDTRDELIKLGYPGYQIEVQ
jgi:translation initiation factor 1